MKDIIKQDIETTPYIKNFSELSVDQKRIKLNIFLLRKTEEVNKSYEYALKQQSQFLAVFSCRK